MGQLFRWKLIFYSINRSAEEPDVITVEVIWALAGGGALLGVIALLIGAVACCAYRNHKLKQGKTN